ncbi:ComF family protein [Patescibacteria group bacterium]
MLSPNKLTNKLTSLITAAIFPASCLGCGADNYWLCRNCIPHVPISHPSECPYCRQTTRKFNTCGQCRESGILNGLWIIGPYVKSWQSIIHHLKYVYLESMIPDIISIISPRLNAFRQDLDKKTVITAVPITKQRRLSRGFNQSELLAKEIAQVMGLKYIPLLKRTGRTKTQSQLTRRGRIDNIKSSMIRTLAVEKMPKFVIIVDDVYTTGATIEACAKVLKNHGASNVWGLALARGKYK